MAINYSLIKIISADESHREFSYQVKKEAEGDYITQVFGWDEKRQQDFHANEWVSKRPSIILYNNKPIGTIYIGKNDNYIEIGQFFILPGYQNQGIGSYILRNYLESADRGGLTAKMAWLYNNPAASLYARMGFKVVEKKDPFVFAERKPLNDNAGNKQ